jgi:hypothetical protein
MSQADNLIGKQFGKLTVLHRYYDNSKLPHAKWVCQCECGKQIIALATNLKKKIRGIKSCGCYVNENVRIANTTHGMYHTAERIIHTNMQIRCLDQNSKDYPNYGGRGILICDRWLGDNGLIHFIEDMGMKPFSDASLERVDVNKGYSKDNCTWIKCAYQSKNRNYNKIKNKAHADRIREEYRLIGISMGQLAKQNDCSVPTISRIIRNEGWT